MKKFFKRYFWTILIVIAALGLAGSAAYFSISGLSKLFAGSAMQVIIMASFIEFSKIATTAALHRYWKSMKTLPMRILKWFLTIMVIVVMAITSSGIYGFLADAYSKTSIELDKIQGKVELIEKQKEQKNIQITGVEEIKFTKTERITTLNDLRVTQEARLDSLYNKGWTSSAKKTQALIDQSTEEIKSLQVEVDSLTNKIQKINEEIGELDIEILDLQNTDVTTEIASLKYISNVTNRPMESIANYFIMAIIIVFDPLAVLLVIFANVVYDNSMGKEEESKPERRNRLIGRIRERFKRKDEPEGEVEPENKTEAPETPSKEELLKMIQEQTEEFNDKHVGEGTINVYPVEELPSEEESNDNYQDVIDAVNNTDPEIFNNTYDYIPEEKGEEVIEYMEDENGNFEKTDNARESIASIIGGIDSNPVYLKLIDILFADGSRKVGDIIPPYKSLLTDVRSRGIDVEERIIKNFLTICNLLEITNMSDKDNVKITKSYESSKQIISLVSK